MRAAITELPASLARAITLAQRANMAEHAEFAMTRGISAYLRDPHSFCQRGSRGPRHQYLPKSTELSMASRAEIAAIQDSLDGRPCKTSAI